MTEYLRKRPFLCVEFSYIPSKKAKTNTKDWMLAEGTVTTLNKVTIVDRVKTKQEIKSSVIIDVVYTKIIKNNTNVPDDVVMEKYMSEYSESILKAIDKWSKDKVNEAINTN